MQFHLENAVLAAAFKEGVKEAMSDPEFRRQLFAHVAEAAAQFVWLTRTEVAAMVGGRSERTVARWAKRGRLEINEQVSAKDPLYSLRSVQAALESGAIRAKKTTAPAAPAPTPFKPANGQPKNGTPLRGVTIARV